MNRILNLPRPWLAGLLIVTGCVGSVLGEPEDQQSALTPALEVSAQAARPGETVVVKVSGGPAWYWDWVGLYRVGGDDSKELTWQYLNGRQDAPGNPTSTASLTFTMPSTDGAYEFRFFPNGGYWPRLATSSTVQVGGGTVGSGCSCSGYDEFKNPVSSTVCGSSVCGIDLQIWTCGATRYQATGQSCGVQQWAAPRVVYDNDLATDVYTHDYLYALAHAGRIQLLANLYTAPDSRYLQFYGWGLQDNWNQYSAAVNSGLRNIPAPIDGAVNAVLAAPVGDRNVLANYQPYLANGKHCSQLPGAVAIVNAARGGKVYVINGGVHTAIACAYLLDPAIVRQNVVMYTASESVIDEYNYWVDPYADFVVFMGLQSPVMLSYTGGGADVWYAGFGYKERLRRLAPSVWRDFMINKNHPALMSQDMDGAPAIYLMNPSLFGVQRMSFSGWERREGYPGQHDVPVFSPNSNGNLLLSTWRDLGGMTNEWWSRVTPVANGL